jgi:hypothetical protein
MPKFLSRNHAATMRIFFLLGVLSMELPLVQKKGLWSSTPAAFEDLTRETSPIGNGRLGGMK